MTPRYDGTAIVTGASRGFGRATATALVGAGARVVGVARTPAPLAELREELGEAFTPVAADAADPAIAERLLAEHEPRLLVLNAGATPHMAPLRDQTWETFSAAWQTDVRHAFHWVRAALRRPLAPGSLVAAMSSGAAVQGSPLSGGYAGAKATIRLLASYASAEARQAELGIRFVSLLPMLTPATRLGELAVAAYAAQAGIDPETLMARRGPLLTAERVGEAILELAGREDPEGDAFLVRAGGLEAIG